MSSTEKVFKVRGERSGPWQDQLIYNRHRLDDDLQWVVSSSESVAECCLMLCDARCNTVMMLMTLWYCEYQIARQHGIPFLETSAKSNINVEKGFLDLTQAILNKVPVCYVVWHHASRSNQGSYYYDSALCMISAHLKNSWWHCAVVFVDKTCLSKNFNWLWLQLLLCLCVCVLTRVT